MVDYLVARASRLSNFNPGSRSASFIEAFALELAKSDLETYNGFSDAIQEGPYNIFKFGRLPGIKASGIIQIEHSGHTNPEVYAPFQIDLFGLKFETLGTVSIPVGETSVTVNARAIDIGLSGNIDVGQIDTAGGQGTITPSLSAGTRVWNVSAFTKGTDEESDSDRQSRFQGFINSLGRATPQGIKYGALSIPNVQSAIVQSCVNPYTQTAETGWVNVFVSDGSASPDPSLLALVLKTIEGDPLDEANFPGYAAAGTRVFVGPITIVPIDVVYELTLRNSSTLTDAQAITQANAAAYDYINSRPTGEDVLYDELKAHLLLANKDDFYEVNLITPSADVTVSGIAQAQLGGTAGGTITGTVIARVAPR